ncbi:nucleoside diphosphate sugar epimerase [Fusarium heterosporum]|uniref:Nucleoside diphosphate sugar epimerase n=1 Tax=Fusarium heterosporum TaxID=42747 RepID=A0A8H5T307_FUSHE|nr:nucleoside diphosphate sugar epimerase [Fusarium heterosporum]
MAPKIFLTGATGFVGGTILSTIHESYPNYEYTLLVRSKDRAKPIAENYPDAKFVYGHHDSTDVIEKAASEADIVIHTAESADTVSEAEAIAKGLTAGHSAENPGYYLHLSGSGVLTWYDLENKRYGEPPLPEQKYNDIHDIDRIINLPDDAYHKNVDNIVQSIDSNVVKYLIVAPPVIYGVVKGMVNKSSLTVPILSEATFDLGYTPYVGAGTTEWDHVHVEDLADLFKKCVEASQDPSKKDHPEIWGKRAYYFTRNGEHKYKDLAEWIAEEAHRQGYIPEPKTQSITFEYATGYKAGLVWGINSKGEAERAKKYLGWERKGPSLKETIAEAVAIAAKAKGLEPKYK